MSGPSLFSETDMPDETPPAASGDATIAPSDAISAQRPAAAQTQSLYRKYRPQTFDSDDLVGQEHVVQTLRNAIALDRIAHAYLFCGPRGTGKTTTARVLAKAVNCLEPDPKRRPCNTCANCQAISSGAVTDVIEIDAASNRGIDDIRDLRERVKYAPTQLRTKFYIIDEAHQITGAAANAFLKTLEEPPAHTKFVLATTDPEELLPTIVSRCQRFDFRRIGLESMIARLRTVAVAEGMTVDDEALAVVARHATGSLRDALGLLDQLAVYREAEGDERREINAGAVRALLGVSRNDRVESLIAAIADRDASSALGAVNAAVEAGEDVRQLNRQLVAYLRVLLHERAGGSPDADDRARELAARFGLLELAELARRFGEIDYRIRHSSFNQLPLEVALVESVLSSQRPAARDESETGPRVVRPREGQRAGGTEPPPEETVPHRPPTTSLRDRVRGNGATPAAPTEASSAPLPPPPTVRPTTSASGEQLDVAQLADLWPRVRQDVKAVNRRIEALLTSIDPVAVSGNQITLASAYPFHRDKLNTDEVRAVVDEAIGRLVGQPVRVSCVLRGEVPPSVSSNAGELAEPPPDAYEPSDQDGAVNGNSSPPPAVVETSSHDEPPPAIVGPPVSSPEDDDRRLQAAKNIFDAEEIG